MRRGQDAPHTLGPDDGFSKQDLLEVSGLSAKTFDTLRKAARVSGPSHGGHTHVFGHHEVISLIQRAESGTFTERGTAAARAWRAILETRGIVLPPPKRLGNARRSSN